jgi:hypothetical protein
MRVIGWLFGVALLAAAGAPVLAQDQAARIKQEVEDVITPPTPAGADGEEAALSHGDVDVAAAGSFYLVTISDLRWGTDATGHFEIGSVSFTLTPEGDDLYRIGDVKMPAQIVHKTPDGSVDGTISLPSQQLAGLWSRSLASLMQLDAVYRDVKLVSIGDNFTLSFGEIVASIASTDKGKGRWDQDYAVHLAGVKLASSDGLISLGSVDGAFGLHDYDIAGWAVVRDRLRALAPDRQTNAATPASLPDLQVTGAQRGASPPFVAANLTMTLRGLSFRDGTGREKLGLPVGTLALGAESFDQPIGRISLSLEQRGLVVNDIAPTERDLLPRELALNIALESLPVPQLWHGAVNTLSTADISTDEGASMAMMTFLDLLQRSLVNGKARLNVTDSHLAMALARARLRGVLEASAESLFGAVGKLVVEVSGLDALIGAVKAHAGPQAEEIADLQVIRGFSTRQTAADGAVVDHYDIDLTRQGQFLVNGKEFSFMGPGGGMPPDAGAPPVEGTTGDAASSPN